MKKPWLKPRLLFLIIFFIREFNDAVYKTPHITIKTAVRQNEVQVFKTSTGSPTQFASRIASSA